MQKSTEGSLIGPPIGDEEDEADDTQVEDKSHSVRFRDRQEECTKIGQRFDGSGGG